MLKVEYVKPLNFELFSLLSDSVLFAFELTDLLSK